MAVELASAYVSLEPQFTGIQAAITRGLAPAGDLAGKTVSAGMQKSLGSRIAGVGLTVGKVLGGGIAAAAATLGGAALTKGLSRALDLQDAQAKLAGLGHSAGDVTKIMGNALDSVRGTAFGLGDAATVAASAVAAGIKPGQELTKYLKLTADSATIAGTSLGDMGSILNSVNANGTVYTGTLNQLSDRGIPVFQYLQQEYGVSADALSSMVSRGQVDAATLDKVLQEHLGGAALKSGLTARGAFDNVGAAFGRLGASLVVGPVQAAPSLFTAIAGAVDRFSAALAPATSTLSGFVTGGMARLTTAINGIDFTTLVTNAEIAFGEVRAVIDTAVAGFKSGGIGGAINALFAGIKLPDLNSAGLSSTFGAIVTIASQAGPVLQALASSFGLVAGSVGQILAAGIKIIAPTLQILAGALGFVADHIGTITQFLPVLIAAFVAWRLATTATLAANRLLTAAQLAALPVTTLNTALRLAAARAELQVAAANGTTTGSIIANGLATARQTVATAAGVVAGLAMRGAQLAGAAATGIATAAQWLFNAALDANPIGIIIVAIAALVAGLIFFFTQTELGRAVFANVVAFIQGAIGGLVSFFQTVFAAIGAFLAQYGLVILAAVAPIIGIPILIATHFSQIVAIVQAVFGAVVAYLSGVITSIVTVVQAGLAFVAGIIQLEVTAWRLIITTVWNAIVSLVTGAINTMRTIITTVLAAIGAAFTLYVNVWRTIITTVWSAIVTLVTTAINRVRAIVTSVFAAISAAFNSYTNAWRTVITTVWNAIASFVSSAVARVRSVVSSGFNAVASVISSVFNAVRSTVSSTWNTVVSTISSAIGRVVSVVSGLGPKILGEIGRIGGSLFSAGKALIQNLINGITSMIGAAGNAIGSVVSKVASFLPHSPAKEGPLSGSGWTAIRTAGEAITTQFASGLQLDAVMTQNFGKLTAPLNSSLRVAGGTSTDLSVASAVAPKTVNYFAAPNASHDTANEALWAFMRREPGL
jgi:tape measure domain-containing protein